MTRLFGSRRDATGGGPPASHDRVLAVLACVLGVVGGSAGCPAGHATPTLNLPLVTTSDPAAEADMQSAREAFDAGEAEEAEQRYQLFLDRHPADPLVPVAHLALGQLRLAAGDVAAAKAHFEIVARHADPAIAERGRFYGGIAAHVEGRHAHAIETLRPFVGRTTDPAETTLLLETLAAASSAQGDRVGAIAAWDELIGSEVSEEIRERARASLEAELEASSPEEIQRATDELPRGGAVWPTLARRALRQAYERNELDRVQSIARALEERGISLDEELQAMVLRAERTTTADPHVVGAILPLSGRGQEVGQVALQGLALALDLPEAGPAPADAMRLVFRDDGGDPERAVRALEELVSLHRVVAVIGPLGGPSADRVAVRARELGVPLFVLSPGVATGDSVVRVFPSPEEETRALVAAARARGASRFATFHPRTPFGDRMRAAFESAVREAGGDAVGAVSYPDTATAFGAEVRELAALDFNAVFVPDRARKLALVAPALAAQGLWSVAANTAAPRNERPITLLAPSVGFEPEALRPSLRNLQGAIFSVPFHPMVATGRGRSFADAFQARFGRPADLYAASAYDAGRLISTAVERGALSRPDLLLRLRDLRMETAGPYGGIGPTGTPIMGTRLVEIRGDTYLAVAPPGTEPR
jgi:ABC-type branched-subunit amino acid transport system substrate-binding protein